MNVCWWSQLINLAMLGLIQPYHSTIIMSCSVWSESCEKCWSLLPTIQEIHLRWVKELSESICACRESNPGHKHGRLVWYRYTTCAWNIFLKENYKRLVQRETTYERSATSQHTVQKCLYYTCSELLHLVIALCAQKTQSHQWCSLIQKAENENCRTLLQQGILCQQCLLTLTVVS